MFKRLQEWLKSKRAMLAGGLVMAVLLSPTFSIDIDAVLTQAFNWVNQLMPVYAVPLGITLGLGILGMLYALLSKAFSRHSV